MRKTWNGLLFLFTFLSGSLFAYIHPGPCEWALQAEFLYLYPSVDDTFFVIDGGLDAPTGARINNDFRFHPGFRVGGVYGVDCNQEVQVYYTRFRETRNKSVSGTELWATIGNPIFTEDFESFIGTATSQLDLLYQQVDALFAQRVWEQCAFNLYFQAGIEYAYLRLNEKDLYQVVGGATGSARRHSKLWGVGPQFGFEFDYDLCQFACWMPGKLSVTGTTRASLLASKARESELDQTTGAGGLVVFNVQDHSTWRVIPSLHARMGLNYVLCFSCFTTSLEVGYEFTSYFRALSRLISADDVSPGTTFTNYYNIDLQGLYVALGVAF